ncbi:hypothetical protein Goarm_009148 [Gossypium armourianum]|uniref:Dirigent protein n=1 Tax=Gossypium armourianum TaxID=34283 RepID=A0A7J9JRY2_9ROSI|nr:hypothetical protein [Gossypium armourianum]
MNFIGVTRLDASFRSTFHLALVSIDLQVNINNDENDTGERSSRLKFFVSLPHVRRLSLSYFLRAQPKEQVSVERSNNFWEDDHYELAVWPPEFSLSSSLVLERLTVKPASLEGERELMKELLRIIFCFAVVIAIAVVVLLALLSPVSHKSSSKNPSRPWLALSMYIQHPQISRSSVQPVAQSDAGAFVFHRALTEGPKNTSRIVGKAQGFIIPIEHFADSAFNIIYLTFETPKFNGSLSIQAKNVEHEDRQELTVVGGTGYFAFARGLAVFMQTKSQSSEADPTYHVKLQLRFPNRSQTIPG